MLEKDVAMSFQLLILNLFAQFYEEVPFDLKKMHFHQI